MQQSSKRSGGAVVEALEGRTFLSATLLTSAPVVPTVGSAVEVTNDLTTQAGAGYVITAGTTEMYVAVYLTKKGNELTAFVSVALFDTFTGDEPFFAYTTVPVSGSIQGGKAQFAATVPLVDFKSGETFEATVDFSWTATGPSLPFHLSPAPGGSAKSHYTGTSRTATVTGSLVISGPQGSLFPTPTDLVAGQTPASATIVKGILHQK